MKKQFSVVTRWLKSINQSSLKKSSKVKNVILCSHIAVLMLFTSQASFAELPNFKDLVKESSPAVVNIATIQKQEEHAAFGFKGPNGDSVPDIFKPFLPSPDKPSAPKGRRTPESLGSGFIISKDGYVLTNHHVIENAEKVFVRLNDRRELEAVVVGSDKRSDVALLKIDATELPIVRIGESDNLEQGEWVLAIGSPFGFDHSVTAGIVSATGRALRSETYVPFIQTDVAINPGNSGGPLFNLAGEVVGINSQIYTRSGGFMGVSFAIPIDIAMNVVDQLKNNGFVSRGWLGVIIQEVSKDLAESFGLERAEGALVVKVLPGSPALEGGLQEGDIILKFENHPIIMSADLPHKVGIVKPGDTAVLDIVRAGELVKLELVIGMLPSEKEIVDQNTKTEPSVRADNPLDLLLEEMSTEQKEEFNLSNGVIVKQVKEGVGAQAGLISGDIITMLNGEKIQSISHLLDIVKESPKDKSLPMRIVRRGGPLFIPIKLK